MPTASIKFTSDFLIEAMRHYRRVHRARYLNITLKVLAVTVLAPGAAWMFWKGRVAAGVFLAAASVFMFVSHHIDYWLARRSFRKSPYRDDDVVIGFSEAGFHARSPKQDTKLQWSAFTKVVEFKDGFLLFQGPRFYNWIPISSLGDASQLPELAALLHANIAEHKIVEPAVSPHDR